MNSNIFPTNKRALVGYTGFVGSNLATQTDFDSLYNTSNISESFGTNPDLLIFSGIRAEKFLANKEPQKDYENIKEAIDNIKKIKPKKIVLISTIDVYKNSVNVNEDTQVDTEGLLPYGLNRHKLESWVEENFQEYLIVRLPSLYGKNIKKNFIYDLINLIPSMLSETKFLELSQKNNWISRYYLKQDNGFYKCKEISEIEKNDLKKRFNDIGFSALNFTDSRSIFQFYNLAYLWNHIDIALKNNIKRLNIATEPIMISELYKYAKGVEFNNEITQILPHYDFKTKHFDLFRGKEGYIFDKKTILEDIKKFIKNDTL